VGGSFYAHWELENQVLLSMEEEINRLWWNLAMNELWHVNSRPKQMSKIDKKKRWKTEYAHLAPSYKMSLIEAQNRAKKEKKKIEIATVKERQWGRPEMTKEELRQFYKSIRSKPRNKRIKGGERTHSVFIVDDEEQESEK